MKAKICLLSLLLAASLPAGAALYNSGTLSGTTIPDDNTLGTGTTLSYIFNHPDSVITDMVLTFALQDGSSSDLSGYLRLGNTGSSPFYDLTTLIQGQSLSPSSATTYTIDFNTSGFHDAFNGLNPNGTWTLFFADSVNGDTTTVNSWSLDITAVPEPVNMAMAVFGVVVVAAGGVRRYLKARNATPT